MKIRKYKLLNCINKIFYFKMSNLINKLINPIDVENLLKKEQIDYHIQEHEEVKTALEYAEKVKCTNNIDFDFIKNLVFKTKSGNFVYYLLGVEQKMETKALESFSCEKNLRAAEDSHLEQYLSVKKGSVNPFALLNTGEDKEKFIVIFDTSLTKDYIAIHPMKNTHSIFMKKIDLLNLLTKYGISYKFWNSKEYILKSKEQQKDKDTGKLKENEKEKEKGKEAEHELEIQADKIKNFPDWYSEVISKSEMIDYYDISGCYILRPWAYSIWDNIHQYFDSRIKKLGVQNCYFPMFVSQDVLEKEKDHVEGFSPEVAWVTHYGDKKLDKKIAIRPTSETIMYPLYSKWIRSHRDLPLLLNQWANVVRWEFKHPTPFIRTREFLWQEGHTAHDNEENADKFMLVILDIYKEVYENLLAVPVIQGYKSENEKFAGALRTSTIETIIEENGKAIQCATSHNLGQNFSKMFNIKYLDTKQQFQYVWQTSWGLTTRTIGVCVMVHGDNRGIVLPPRVAPIQVVIIPIRNSKETTNEIIDTLQKVTDDLASIGIRVKYDNEETHSPGFKYNFWERKGVPIRIEMGRKDLDKELVTIVFRDTLKKETCLIKDVKEKIPQLLEDMQLRLFQKAKDKYDNNRKKAYDFKSFVQILNEKAAPLTPWCNNKECEDQVKKKIKDISNDDENSAGTCKTLCVPFNQIELEEKDICFNCGGKAKKWALWGRSY